MKPRISRHFPSIRWLDFRWKCHGDGSVGLGTTPSEAYWDWKAWVDRKTKHLAWAKSIDRMQESVK